MRAAPLLLAGLLAAVACSGDDTGGATTAAPATSTAVTSTAATTPATTTTPAVSRASPRASERSGSATTTTTPAGTASTVAELLALGRPIVLAHTGGEDEFPGSTMFSFGESMAAGVDALDLNVQLTGDGVLVVHHDDSVDRTTNGSGEVAEMDLASIQALDDAYWFTADCVCAGRPDADYLYRGIRTGERPPPPGYTADDFAVPTLRQLIERYPDVPLNIEVKGDGQHALDAAAALVDELTALDRLDATVVSAFDDAVVAELQRLAPSMEASPGLDRARRGC